MYAAVLLLLACATPPTQATALSASACTDAPAVTWDAWGHGFFLTWCASCHSATTPDRRGAPDGVDFDSWEEVQARQADIRARVIDEASMPVGGGLSDDELALLEVLLTCSR